MEKIRFSIQIRKEINEILKRKAKEHLISKNALINLILSEEVKEYEIKDEK